MPLTQAGDTDTAFFQLDFYQPGRDLHDTTATFRVRAPSLENDGQAYLRLFAIDTNYTFGSGPIFAIDISTFGDTGTFIDVALDVGAILSAGFDDTRVVAIGIQLGATPSFQSPFTPKLLLDSIAFAGSSGLADLTFADNAQGFHVNPDSGLQTAAVVHY